MLKTEIETLLNNLAVFGQDWRGRSQKFELPDSLRLVISAYKLGYSDGVEESKGVILAQYEQEELKKEYKEQAKESGDWETGSS